MELFFYEGESIPKGSQLIVSLPSPDAGNLGLMCMDCILSTLKATRIGNVESRYLIGLTGYEEYHPEDGPSLCMPFEVYRIHHSNIILFHQRSTCLGRDMASFMKEYEAFIESFEFEGILFLSSEHVSTMPDEYVHGNRIFSLIQCKNSNEKMSRLIQACEPIRLDQFATTLQSSLDYELEDRYHQETYSYTFFARTRLLDKSCNSVLLGVFSTEVGRVDDAKSLVAFVLSKFPFPGNNSEISSENIRTPKSWAKIFFEEPAVPLDEAPNWYFYY